MVEISVKIGLSNIRCHVLAEVFGRSPCWSAHSHIRIGEGKLGSTQVLIENVRKRRDSPGLPKRSSLVENKSAKHHDT